jgi:hypothetical protein
MRLEAQAVERRETERWEAKAAAERPELREQIARERARREADEAGKAGKAGIVFMSEQKERDERELRAGRTEQELKVRGSLSLSLSLSL